VVPVRVRVSRVTPVPDSFLQIMSTACHRLAHLVRNASEPFGGAAIIEAEMETGKLFPDALLEPAHVVGREIVVARDSVVTVEAYGVPLVTPDALAKPVDPVIQGIGPPQ